MSIRPPSSTSPTFLMAPPAAETATQTVGGFLRTALRTAVAIAMGDPIVFRQEVPIERWLRDHGLLEPIKGTKEELRARGFAILATLEGLVRTLAETISLFYASYISKNASEAEKHQLVFKTQMKSLQLSALAIISPNTVKEHIKTECSNEERLIFCRTTKMRWGTEYYGKITVSPLSLDCSCYPWLA
jgi:hypothetical protein